MAKLVLNIILLLILISCIGNGRKNIEKISENVENNNGKSEVYERFFNVSKIAAIENEEFRDISLIPYIESGSWGDGASWRNLGYINSGTFEIMIPAQYRYAGPFVYGYAVVQNNIGSADEYDWIWHIKDRHKYKYNIINKKGTEILAGFDSITLLDTENGDFLFALTVKYLEIDYETFLHPPKIANYQLFNLSTGNILIEEDTRPYHYENSPKIMFFANYMVYDDDIYEIKDNGTLEKTEADIESLVSIIIKERNLTYKENNFHYHGNSYNFDSYFRYFDILDFNLLLQNIPDNMRIIEIEESEKQLYDEKPVYYIQPINRDRIRPLKKNKLLYEVRLADKKSSEGYIGLYDPEENKWAIPPIKKDNEKGHWDEIGFFGMGISGYEDWIRYTYFEYFSSDEYLDNSRSYYASFIYNIIRERKIYPFTMDDGFMMYWEHHKRSIGKWTTKDY